MLNKPISEIIESDIQALIDNQVSEQKTLEYKLLQPDLKDLIAKKEFLADIVSFANSQGGTILYGITEEGGIAVGTPGITIDNLDKLKLQIQEIIISHVEPRLSGIEIDSIQLSTGTSVLILRIAKSWIGPHIVWFDKKSNFFCRHTNGKYHMDFIEIRNAFDARRGPRQELKTHRHNAVQGIATKYDSVWDKHYIGLVLQILPLSSIADSLNIDLKKLNPQNIFLSPLAHGTCPGNYNFEGYLSCVTGDHGLYDTYLQIHRNGILEYMKLISHADNRIHLPHMEKIISNHLSNITNLLKSLEIPTPVYICIDILNTNGKKEYYSDNVRYGSIDTEPILFLPEIEVDKLEDLNMNRLKPAFDVLYNAFGCKESHSYDNKGNFVGN